MEIRLRHKLARPDRWSNVPGWAVVLIITLPPWLRACPLGSHDFHSFVQPETSLYKVEPGIPLITATFPTSAENQNDARIVRFRLTRSSIDEIGQSFAVRFVIGSADA